MDEAKIATDSDILFVATVGEEGLGDLRGVKHLFFKGSYKDKIKAFIAFDGVNPAKIMTTTLGSRRYRLTFTGPGGHSYHPIRHEPVRRGRILLTTTIREIAARKKLGGEI